jgi:AcrR family transcriptional regulator
MSDPTITMAEIADQVGVASSTLYRSFPGGREAIQPS